MKKITVLTREVSIQAFVVKNIRNLLRFLKYALNGFVDTDILFFSGHAAVTKSLIQGLGEMKADFVYNPILEKDISDMVVVISDMKALNQAIQWKKEGKIKKLLAGPSLLDLPTKYNHALSAKEIDTVLVTSEWVKQVYEKLNPGLTGKIAIWYSGIDEKYWLPAETVKQKEILVYWKNTTPKSFCLEVESMIKKHGYIVHRIRYGYYTKAHYKKILDQSMYAVFLSMTESQGLALAEAWAMNVPTLVWDPEMGHPYVHNITVTSAPYLSEQTGMKWKELDEFESLLNGGELAKKTFSPREWVLKHMTDKISAQMLVDIANTLYK